MYSSYCVNNRGALTFLDILFVIQTVDFTVPIKGADMVVGIVQIEKQFSAEEFKKLDMKEVETVMSPIYQYLSDENREEISSQLSKALAVGQSEEYQQGVSEWDKIMQNAMKQ
jgi:hypothetical protein